MASPDLSGLHVAIFGNVGPDSAPYSTENEWRHAYEHHGIRVSTFCEKHLSEWERLADFIHSDDCPDWVHWTSTPPWRAAIGRDAQAVLLAVARTRAPLVGVHLDRFWDIRDREQWVRDDPYFKVDLFVTADGGNDQRWADAGVNHRWMLPGVGERWCHRGEEREEYVADIAFVGSWRQYHNESRHRRELLSFLSRTYPKFQRWPRRRHEAVRGDDLTDLYWSTKVVVGDSFFPSRDSRRLPPPNYSSDRISESLGRGAILLHTEVPGITDGPFDVPNLLTYPAWGWGVLKRQIEEALEWTPAVRTRKRNAGIKHIKQHHTYEKRVLELVEMLHEEGLL